MDYILLEKRKKKIARKTWLIIYGMLPMTE